MKNSTINWFFLFAVLTIVNVNGQQKEIKYEVNLNAGLSSDTTLPFWLEANRFGTIPNSNHLLLNASFFSDFNKPANFFDFSYKVNLTGYIASENKALINELYFSVKLRDFIIDLGSKNDAVLWNNLSSSNGNILKSTNARAMPGINVKTDGFVSLPFIESWFGLKGNFSHYFINDNRAVEDAYLHNKSIWVKFMFLKRFELIGGFEHYAFWGGTSEVFGKQPASFSDFVRIVLGQDGDNDSLPTDQANALGNHLGNYLFQINYNGKKSNISFYYSHPFEDGSGREMVNWRDGLYGLNLNLKNPGAIVNQILGEFTYTKDMSGDTHLELGDDGEYHGRGLDNYFNHSVYTSGWTYYGKTIGSPYFTPTVLNEDGISEGVIKGDNRFMAFNIGVQGNLFSIQYKALLSHTTYFGWFEEEYEIYPTQFSGLLEFYIPEAASSLPFEISVSTSFDTGTYRPVNFGGFIGIKKIGNIF